MLLQTNGTVMVQQYQTGKWWRLTPDKTGSYIDGTWTQMGSLPAGYTPEYYGSAVLPDGRVIIMGGEYNGVGGPPSNQGAIYNPVTNTWATVNPPSGWTGTGDAETVVLANGKLMLAQALQKIGSSIYCGGSKAALLNASTLTWTATGTGKNPTDGCPYDEQGWTLLPDGQVLTVDTWRTTPSKNTEVYTPLTGAWTSAGDTPAVLGVGANGEMGPALLRPNGTVFATGASGKNAVFNTATKAWSAAPSFPVIGGLQYDVADGPSAVLPDGDVLTGSSPGYGNTPEHFYDFNGSTLSQVADPPLAASLSSYFTYMVVLPTGQILCRQGGALEIYTGGGSPLAAWRPTVTSVPTSLAPGGTYTVSGRQLNGLTQGSAYGDDYQSTTNYPLVRITNTATHHVFYANLRDDLDVGGPERCFVGEVHRAGGDRDRSEHAGRGGERDRLARQDRVGHLIALRTQRSSLPGLGARRAGRGDDLPSTWWWGRRPPVAWSRLPPGSRTP